MKFAIISDIHGNVPALQSVLEDITQWQPDKLIINGDVVSRGPYSDQVLNILRDFDADKTYIKGNHEDFVLFAHENPLSETDYDYHLRCFAQWTAKQLSQQQLNEIEAWEENFDYQGHNPTKTLHVTHGSRIGNRDGIHLKLSEDELKEKEVHHSDIFISSHTHLPMTRYLEKTLVMNTGSVGQPLDGDDRSAYGKVVITNDSMSGEIARVRYDKKQAEMDFHESGFLDHGGPISQLIYLEHKHNRRIVGPFMQIYLEEIKSRKISIVDAVEKYLDKVAI